MPTDNNASESEGRNGEATDATPESLAGLRAALRDAIDRVEVLEDKERRAAATARLLGLDVMILSRTFNDRLHTLELMLREQQTRETLADETALDRVAPREGMPETRILEIEARDEETRAEPPAGPEPIIPKSFAPEPFAPEPFVPEPFVQEVFEEDAPLVLSSPIKETRTRNNRLMPYLAVAVAAMFILVVILYSPRREPVSRPPSTTPVPAATAPAATKPTVVEGHMLYGVTPGPAQRPAPLSDLQNPAPQTTVSGRVKSARGASEDVIPETPHDETTGNRAASVSE